jgi:hypothetical protein
MTTKAINISNNFIVKKVRLTLNGLKIEDSPKKDSYEENNYFENNSSDDSSNDDEIYNTEENIIKRKMKCSYLDYDKVVENAQQDGSIFVISYYGRFGWITPNPFNKFLSRDFDLLYQDGLYFRKDVHRVSYSFYNNRSNWL